MKIEKTYVSYDGFRWDSEKECVEHENYAWDMIKELTSRVKFLDSTYSELVPYELKDLEEIIGWIETAYASCDSILIQEPLSDSCDVFVINLFGFRLPDNAGMYKYDWNYMDWVKVNAE